MMSVKLNLESAEIKTTHYGTLFLIFNFQLSTNFTINAGHTDRVITFINLNNILNDVDYAFLYICKTRRQYKGIASKSKLSTHFMHTHSRASWGMYTLEWQVSR